MSAHCYNMFWCILKFPLMPPGSYGTNNLAKGKKIFYCSSRHQQSHSPGSMVPSFNPQQFWSIIKFPLMPQGSYSISNSDRRVTCQRNPCKQRCLGPRQYGTQHSIMKLPHGCCSTNNWGMRLRTGFQICIFCRETHSCLEKLQPSWQIWVLIYP